MPLTYIELAIDVLINSLTLSLCLACISGIASKVTLTGNVSISLSSLHFLVLQFSLGRVTICNAHIFAIHAYFRLSQSRDVIGLFWLEGLLSFIYFQLGFLLWLKECKFNSSWCRPWDILYLIEKRPKCESLRILLFKQLLNNRNQRVCISAVA